MPSPPAAVRSKGRTAFLFLLAFLSLIVFGWLSENSPDGKTLPFDNRVLALVHQQARPALTSAMMLASDAGAARSLALQDLIAIALFWFRHRRREAAMAALSLSGAIVLTSLLKIAFPRTRPAPFFHLAVPHSSSFPSGHALESFCFYATLAGLFATVSGALAARLAAWIAALAILLIGFSRLYLGLHYPTDVLAGYAAGAVWTALLAIFQTKLYTCG